MAGSKNMALRKLSRRSDISRRDVMNIRMLEEHRIVIFVFSCDGTDIQHVRARSSDMHVHGC